MRLKGRIIACFRTIENFCKATGWSRRKITDIIYERQKMTKSDILVLADALNIRSVDEFMYIFFDELSTKWTSIH